MLCLQLHDWDFGKYVIMGKTKELKKKLLVIWFNLILYFVYFELRYNILVYYVHDHCKKI